MLRLLSSNMLSQPAYCYWENRRKFIAACVPAICGDKTMRTISIVSLPVTHAYRTTNHSDFDLYQCQSNANWLHHSKR